jgi:hypothetical protein
MLAAIAAATTHTTRIWETGAYLKPDVSMVRENATSFRWCGSLLLQEFVGDSGNGGSGDG